MSEENKKTKKPKESFKPTKSKKVLKTKETTSTTDSSLKERLEKLERDFKKSEKKVSHYPKVLIWVVIVSVVFGVVGCMATERYLVPYLAAKPFFQKYVKPLIRREVNINENRTVHVKEESKIIDAVKKISPSVVSISTSKNVYDFFGQVQEQKGGGTGFIITSDGLILTNKHVVSAGDKYTVITSDGKTYEAKVKAKDPTNDIAFLKIDAENLPVADLGYSKDLEVGQTVIAIGYALGEYENTVTVGVVSALDRAINASGGVESSTERLEGVIQTDAAINPGNSGGPLINLAGQVVGINTAMDTEGQQIGFAIPIDVVRPAITSVIEKGKIIRPMIGVRYIPINKKIAELNKLPVDHGALIYSDDPKLLPVIPGSPAAKAGLKKLDIILKVNDEEITEDHGLSYLIQKYQPGDEITLIILRDEKEMKVKVKLSEMKE